MPPRVTLRTPSAGWLPDVGSGAINGQMHPIAPGVLTIPPQTWDMVPPQSEGQSVTLSFKLEGGQYVLQKPAESPINPQDIPHVERIVGGCIKTSPRSDASTQFALHPRDCKPETTVLDPFHGPKQELSPDAFYDSWHLQPAQAHMDELPVPDATVVYSNEASETEQEVTVPDCATSSEYKPEYLKLRSIIFEDWNYVWCVLFSRLGGLPKDPCASILRKLVDVIENARDRDQESTNKVGGRKFHRPSWWPIGRIEWKVPTRLRVEDKKAMIAYIIMMPHWQSRVCKEVLRVSQTDRWSDILGRAFTSAQLKTSYNKANPRQQYSYYDDYEDPQSAEETRDSELTEEELEDRTTFLNECCMVANCIQDVADGCRDTNQTCGLQEVPQSLQRVMYGRGKPRKTKNGPGASITKHELRGYDGGPSNWPEPPATPDTTGEDFNGTEWQDDGLQSPVSLETIQRKRSASSLAGAKDVQQYPIHAAATVKRPRTNKAVDPRAGQTGAGAAEAQSDWAPDVLPMRPDGLFMFDHTPNQEIGRFDETATEPDEDLAAEQASSLRRDSYNPTPGEVLPYSHHNGSMHDGSFSMTPAEMSFSNLHDVSSSEFSHSFSTMEGSGLFGDHASNSFTGFMPQSDHGFGLAGLPQASQASMTPSMPAHDIARPLPTLTHRFSEGSIKPRRSRGSLRQKRSTSSLRRSASSTLIPPSSCNGDFSFDSPLQTVLESNGDSKYHESYSIVQFVNQRGVQRQALAWNNHKPKPCEQCYCEGCRLFLASPALAPELKNSPQQALAGMPEMTGPAAFCVPGSYYNSLRT